MNARLANLKPEWAERLDATASWLTERGYAAPVGLVLGSGLGSFADGLDGAEAIDYGEIPGFTATSVAEHKGRLVTGEAAGRRVLVMQGRIHPYEGLPPETTLFPTAVLAALGVDSAVITNAAGGLNRFYVPGDLMIIRDQLDMHLDDPLRGLWQGAGDRAGGPRFDPELAGIMAEAGAEAGIPLHQGVYASMWGPAYETKAEIGMLRRLECDAVGMSTAPEVALLSRLGVKVAGLSCITNPAREVGQPELSHQDVVEVGRMVRDRMARLMRAYLSRLPA